MLYLFSVIISLNHSIIQSATRLGGRGEYEAPRYLSTPHLGLAALHLYFSPPDSRDKYYLMYWAVIGLRPLLLLLVQRFPKSFSFGEAALVSQGVKCVHDQDHLDYSGEE